MNSVFSLAYASVEGMESVPHVAVDAEDGECSHQYLDKWGPLYHCKRCGHNLNRMNYASRYLSEAVLEENTGIDRIPDGLAQNEIKTYIGKKSRDRGVSIRFLLAFTNKYNCWSWNSMEVIRKIIMPATKVNRERFVELPEMSCYVGPAHTFISYAQAGKWGDMMAAILDGGADVNRYVWIDVFAVRQWPSSSPDLDFASTIEHCQSFLIVCSSVKEVCNAYSWDICSRRSEVIPFSERKKIAFFRVWCLAEVNQAASMKKIPIIMKCGSYDLSDDGLVKFVSNRDMLHNLCQLIDIRQADATVSSDKEMIMTSIANSYGVDALNNTIRGALYAGYEISRIENSSLVQCAACGDREAFMSLIEDSASIVAVASGGYIALYEDMIKAGYKLNIHATGGNNSGSLLMFAAAGGHLEMVQRLISMGADVNAKDKNGDCPLERAAKVGHYEICDVLLRSGADVRSVDNSGTDILYRAAISGHAEIATLLISYGININKEVVYKAAEHGHAAFLGVLMANEASIDDFSGSFHTPLMIAARVGHIECVKLLLEHHADVNATNMFSGETSLMLAALEGHTEVVSILLSYGADITYMSSKKMTAMNCATKRGHLACAEKLDHAEAAFDSLQKSTANKLKDIILDNCHPHSLQKIPFVPKHLGIYTCDVCQKYGGSGFHFCCKLCGFTVHPTCMDEKQMQISQHVSQQHLIPMRVSLHPHALTQSNADRAMYAVCNVCHQRGDCARFCHMCDWDVCSKCLASAITFDSNVRSLHR